MIFSPCREEPLEVVSSRFLPVGEDSDYRGFMDGLSLLLIIRREAGDQISCEAQLSNDPYRRALNNEPLLLMPCIIFTDGKDGFLGYVF